MRYSGLSLLLCFLLVTPVLPMDRSVLPASNRDYSLNWRSIESSKDQILWNEKKARYFSMTVKVGTLLGVTGCLWYMSELSKDLRAPAKIEELTHSNPDVKAIAFKKIYPHGIAEWSLDILYKTVDVGITVVMTGIFGYAFSLLKAGRDSLQNQLGIIASEKQLSLEQYKEYTNQIMKTLLKRAYEYEQLPTIQEKQHYRTRVESDLGVILTTMNAMLANMLVEMSKVKNKSKKTAETLLLTVREIFDTTNQNVQQIIELLDQEKPLVDAVQTWIKKLEDQEERFMLFVRVNNF